MEKQNNVQCKNISRDNRAAKKQDVKNKKEEMRLRDRELTRKEDEYKYPTFGFMLHESSGRANSDNLSEESKRVLDYAVYS